MSSSPELKRQQLITLAAIIDSHPDWWYFPAEGPVQGFFGTDPLFIVGDQPSTSEWGPSHPNRRAFYDLLPRVGAANAHLTDIYKRRGRAGALNVGIPEDFSEHLAIFRKEVEILKPMRVLALGHHAHHLLSQYTPELRPILGRVWHFSYVVRYGKISMYEENMRAGIEGLTTETLSGAQGGSATDTERKIEEAPKDENRGKLIRRVDSAPRSSKVLRWTLRDDNMQHYHNRVWADESPVYVELKWRADAHSQVHVVGIFRLDLRALLSASYIRREKSHSDEEVRVRFYRAANGMIYLQTRQGEPALFVAPAPL